MSKSAMKMGLKFSESQLPFVRRLSENSDGQFFLARGFRKVPMGSFTEYIGSRENRLISRLSV